MLSNTSSNFISGMDDIENKIKDLHLQECSLKNRSLWKLVISLEASFFTVTVFIYSIMEV